MGKNSHMSHLRFLLVFVAFSHGPTLGCMAEVQKEVGRSTSTQQIAATRKNKSTTGPYCGAFCMYAALKHFGLDVSPVDLIDPRYITSRQGSTIRNLETMAQDFGLHTFTVRNACWTSLRRSELPVILHLKQGSRSQGGHYVLFGGLSADRAWVLDPPEAPRQIPMAELDVDWDGMAMFLSKDPIDGGEILYPTRPYALFLCLVCVILGMALRFLLDRTTSVGRTLTPAVWAKTTALQSILIAVSALLPATAYHCLSPLGFFAGHDAVNLVQQQNLGAFLPRVDSDEVRSLIAGQGVAIVDARRQRDYVGGHVHGAISIEPSSDVETVRDKMRHLSRNAEIIVYCQSAGCPYATRVAGLLREAGYYHVLYFKGGWEEWQEEGVD